MFPSFHCVFAWIEDGHTEQLPELKSQNLRSIPRIGEGVWIPDAEEGYDYIVRVQDVIHVAQTDEEFPYIELHVVLDERRVAESVGAETPQGRLTNLLRKNGVQL